MSETTCEGAIHGEYILSAYLLDIDCCFNFLG